MIRRFWGWIGSPDFSLVSWPQSCALRQPAQLQMDQVVIARHQAGSLRRGPLFGFLDDEAEYTALQLVKVLARNPWKDLFIMQKHGLARAALRFQEAVPLAFNNVVQPAPTSLFSR